MELGAGIAKESRRGEAVAGPARAQEGQPPPACDPRAQPDDPRSSRGTPSWASVS